MTRAIDCAGVTAAADRSSIPVIAKEDTNLQGAGGGVMERVDLLTRHLCQDAVRHCRLGETVMPAGLDVVFVVDTGIILWRKKQVRVALGLVQEVSKNCGVQGRGVVGRAGAGLS